MAAAKPSSAAQHAANALNYFLKRMTGAALPVTNDAQPVAGPVVLIGASTELAARRVDTRALENDNFLIRSGKNFVDKAQNTPIEGGKKASNRYLSRWPAAKAEQALTLLDQADAAAADPTIKGRIELSRVSLGYVRENSRVFALERQYRQSGGSDRP